MMDVAIVEDTVDFILRVALFGEYSHQYSFMDRQFVKKILNQFKALNLVYSNWNSDKSKLFWGLTTKGELVRNKMILVRTVPQNSNEP